MTSVSTITLNKRWFVYMVRCADRTLYTGIATDVNGRTKEHNKKGGRGAKYTASRRPVVLVYWEACDSRSHACKREYAIKQLSRSDKEQLIFNLNK